MSGFLRRQLHEALAPLERMALGLLRQAALAVIALASLFACLAFLSVAGFIWLSGLVGAALAALALAGIYMLIALVCLLAARGRSTAAKSTQGAAESHQTPHVAAARAAQNPKQQNTAQPDRLEQTATQADEDMRSENIDAALAPILAVLQEAGLQRTNIGVLVAAAVAKQINPFVLVATAFALGFTFSRRKP
jgi:hypothetical protein